jgi:uncharacterized protein (TIGR00251 family)
MNAPLAMREHADGVSFDVVVVARASRSQIIGLHGDALKVSLAAAPVEGAANVELCAVLAKRFGVTKSSVSLVRGEHAKHKTVYVRGIHKTHLLTLLAEFEA